MTIDKFPFKVLLDNLQDVDPQDIVLVPYEDDTKPVVRAGKVYQICFLDWDGDCILKDKINGLHIIKGVSSGDDTYDKELIETFPDHPFRTVRQILYNDEILAGSTIQLQHIIDLYYGKKSDIFETQLTTS